MTTTEMVAEFAWRNRASLSSSMYHYENMNAPAFRTAFEKFEMQARHAALALNFDEDTFTLFSDRVIQRVKAFETLNGGALVLLFHECYDPSTGRLNQKAVKTFLQRLPTVTSLKKYVQEYGITPQDLVRYVRFYQTTLA